MPFGGSVTLCSSFFIVLIAYWYGPAVGMMAGVAFGLLQFVLGPFIISLPQVLFDYPLAFGALGVAGFFYHRKHGLLIGYIAGMAADCSSMCFPASSSSRTTRRPVCRRWLTLWPTTGAFWRPKRPSRF